MKTITNNTMKNSIKVASWEVKKLIWNKAFVISLLLTPIFFGLFMGLPILFERIAEREYRHEEYRHEEDIPWRPATHIYIIDGIGIYELLSQKMADIDNLVFEKYTGHKDDLRNHIKDDANAGYIHITEEIFETREISIITGGWDTYVPFVFDTKLIQALMYFELAKYNVGAERIEQIIAGYSINVVPLIEEAVAVFNPMDFIRKWASPAFAMAIFAMILFSGMATIQSTISDKRDKMVEILLSSVSASSLMYGKIIGNFLAGLIQMAVYGIYVVIFLHFLVLPRFEDVSVYQLLSYILSPELPLLLLFALLGYILFSALYVSLGATMEDIQSAGNFQGIVMFLPALPLLFMTYVIADPGGIIAQIGSYIPLTTAIVMILRMTLLDLSLVEIAFPLIILLVSTVLTAKLAGKIFKTGMLMYGKGAGLREMWKWVRQ